MDANRWLVTARHLDISNPLGRQPLGVRHARRSGDNRTACGQWAIGWRMFWHLPFDAEAATSCDECSRAVRLPVPQGATA